MSGCTCYVIQPTNEIGRVAARLLLRQIEEGADFLPETQTLDTTLVIQKSTHSVFKPV